MRGVAWRGVAWRNSTKRYSLTNDFERSLLYCVHCVESCFLKLKVLTSRQRTRTFIL